MGWLTSCEPDALACGANLAILDGELLQFSDARPLGDGHFRLRGLIRGVGGTVPSAHGEGTQFVLARPETLRMIELPPWTAGQQATVRAERPDGGAVLASAIVQGVPRSPLHGTALKIDGQQVVAHRRPAITSPAGGNTVDFEAREAISSLLATMRGHGLIES